MFARVVRGQGGIVRLPFDVQPTSATVTLTRADGTAVVTDATATPDTEGATYQVTPAQADALGVLVASWALDVGGEAQTAETVVEVVGARVVTLAELRSVNGLEAMTDDELEVGRLLGETALEDACRVAFTKRGRRVRLDSSGVPDLLLPVPMLQSVVAGSIDGTAMTADDLSALVVYEAEGTVYNPNGWPCGRQNVVLDVEHGFPTPPGRVPQAVKALARHALLESPLDDRSISASSQDGTVQVFVQAGVRGAVFAIPEANATAQQYGFVGVT